MRGRGTTTGLRLACALLGLALAACSGSGAVPPAAPSRPPTTAPASPTPPAHPRVYVAVGASETVGVGADDPATQAWPRVLHDRTLPGTKFVDVGVSGATVTDALQNQLPRALAARPDVVTVWLAVNDLISLTPVEDYEARLGELVHALRRGGRTEVLVANVPPLDRLPAYLACLPGSGVTDVACVLPLVPSPAEVRRTVAAFNAAVARVVAREGAVAVDLSGERDLAGLTSRDGFHPSTRGHKVVARAFAAALREG
jgi:acyl-CoA thioesterase-1